MIERKLARIQALWDTLPADEVFKRYTALARLQQRGKAHIHCSLALFQMRIGDFDGALRAIDAALAMQKEPTAYFIKGRVCDERNDPAGAIPCYRQCLALDPGHDKARFYLALAHLCLGDFANGAPLYPARLSAEQVARVAGVPLWSPQAPRGRVLVWAEQGIGDEVMFLQLLHCLNGLDFAFTVECDRRLIALFEATFPSIAFVPRSAAVDPKPFDLQIAMGDLLGVFHEALLAGGVARPSLVPIARADIATLADAAKPDRRLIGLSWFSTSADYGARRSVAIETLLDALDPARHAIAILQYSASAEDVRRVRARGFRCIAEMDALDDIAGVFALTAACDAVLTIDNSVAHFAGAVGTETHLLLPDLPNWRWGIAGERSYWYPSLRLHRRAAGLDWAALVDRIAPLL